MTPPAAPFGEVDEPVSGMKLMASIALTRDEADFKLAKQVVDDVEGAAFKGIVHPHEALDKPSYRLAKYAIALKAAHAAAATAARNDALEEAAVACEQRVADGGASVLAAAHLIRALKSAR